MGLPYLWYLTPTIWQHGLAEDNKWTFGDFLHHADVSHDDCFNLAHPTVSNVPQQEHIKYIKYKH